MEKYIWVGHRESEIYSTNNLFEYSLTSWGSNKNGNISYSAYSETRSIDIIKRNAFFIEKLKELLCQGNHQIMFYNSALAYTLIQTYPSLEKYACCINPKSQLDILNNKIHTRLWLANHISVIPFTLLAGAECQFPKLLKSFPDCNQFIIQEARSAGGTGTFLINKRNCDIVLKCLSKSTLYMVSRYIEPAISLNAHILITKEDIIVFPSSIQIIEQYNNNLLYSGADYICYKHLPSAIRKEIYEKTKVIGALLKNTGYYGICGIDFLLHDDTIYFTEINPRFQASTLLLNIVLKQRMLPSVQELQLMTFDNNINIAIAKLETLEINYSLYKYVRYNSNNIFHYWNKLRILEKSNNVFEILLDGYRCKTVEDGDYLYSVILKSHITSCSDDDKLHIHPNILIGLNDLKFSSNYSQEELIHLKIMLLNQGIRILQCAQNEIEKDGGYNESVFNSIDLILFEKLRFNAPVKGQFTNLSPFALAYKNNKYILQYYDIPICAVKLELSKSIRDLKTRNEIQYKNIAFISGDRLRIKPEQRCFFKMTGKGCSFCPGIIHSPKSVEGYSLADIQEVVDYCIMNEEFRHILIGGGSSDPCTDNNKLISVIQYIRNRTEKPLYLMALPPNTTDELNAYISAGVNEIAFNIEIYDRKLAQKYMPGKGMYPLEHYIKLLNHAVFKLGKGNVRSMLIVGIESIDNTLKCIELLCKNDIQPMLSVFRPAINCGMSHIIPPSNTDLFFLYEAATEICNNYGLTLGPTCPSCQNNTLALTLI